MSLNMISILRTIQFESYKNGEDIKKLPHDHPGKALSDVWSEVSIEATSKGDIVVVGHKLFIPKAIRPELLRALHATHTCANIM